MEIRGWLSAPMGGAHKDGRDILFSSYSYDVLPRIQRPIERGSRRVARHHCARTRMEIRRGRSIEVYFFRGAVLIVIVLDHIPGSTLSHLMLHAYALCDAAEVFVFLGGYASAAAYTAVLAGRGENAARMRFVR